MGLARKGPALRLYPEPKRRIRWITPEQVQTLLSLLPEHQRDLVTFALATGLRHGNVLGLEWSQVDLQRKVAWIYGDQAKGGRDIHVSLNETALGALQRQLGKHPLRVFVFRDKPIAAANTRAWREALRKAGIADFRWHDLRHTWASWLAQSGVPMAVIQEMGAWESPEMVRRYAHLSPAVLADHAKVIDTKMAQSDVCGGETVPNA
jgi:integrase